MLLQSTSVGPFTYKRVGDVSFKVDVDLPNAANLTYVNHPLPVLLWFHGGGVTSGSRAYGDWTAKWLYRDALAAGFIVVSADYTLLSPADGHAIIEDVKVLFTWLSLGFNKELASLGTTSIRADPANIVATGPSAGGFGLYGSPKPKAICSLYGPPCDLSDHWVIPKEKPFFGTPPKQFPLYTSNEKFLPFLTASPNAPPMLETSLDPTKDARVEYIAWLMQTATFYDKLFGEEGFSAKLAVLPYESRAGAVSDAANDLIPILKADARFPPTIFVHGTEDPIVPVEESRLFARVLAGYGIETKVIEVVGAVHGFDNKPGFDGAGLEGVVRFLLKHVAA